MLISKYVLSIYNVFILLLYLSVAPEIIEMTGHSGTACDIWSVGCTVIELLTGLEFCNTAILCSEIYTLSRRTHFGL